LPYTTCANADGTKKAKPDLPKFFHHVLSSTLTVGSSSSITDLQIGRNMQRRRRPKDQRVTCERSEVILPTTNITRFTYRTLKAHDGSKRRLDAKSVQRNRLGERFVAMVSVSVLLLKKKMNTFEICVLVSAPFSLAPSNGVRPRHASQVYSKPRLDHALGRAIKRIGGGARARELFGILVDIRKCQLV
jgi:hypothetical protein